MTPRKKGQCVGEGHVQLYLADFGIGKIQELYKDLKSIHAIRLHLLTRHEFSCSYNSLARFMKDNNISVQARGGDRRSQNYNR